MVMTRQRSQPPEEKDDATVARRLKDPGFDKLKGFSSEKLESLRRKFASYQIVHNEIGMNFSNFLANLKGMNPVPIKGFTFMALISRGSVFVLSNKTPETSYEAAQGLMGVDFKRKCILENPEGKRMYVSMISPTEYNLMLSLAVQTSMAPQVTGTIAPQADGAIPLEQFKQKLLKCALIFTTDPDFNLKKFAESVDLVSPFRGDDDQRHYYLVVGKDERGYILYVNPKARPDMTATRLSYGNDHCVLKQED